MAPPWSSCNGKETNGVSDKGFGEFLKLVKKMLPKDNKLPTTTYEAKQLICPLGLEVQKIHACPNDCILYRGEYENLDACPVCSALRYKIRKDDPGDDLGQILLSVRADCESEKKRLKFQKMLEDHQKLLYLGYEDGLKKLGTTQELLEWKAKNGVSDKRFGELLKLF